MPCAPYPVVPEPPELARLTAVEGRPAAEERRDPPLPRVELLLDACPAAKPARDTCRPRKMHGLPARVPEPAEDGEDEQDDQQYE
jgi:hypothetical protein